MSEAAYLQLLKDVLEKGKDIGQALADAKAQIEKRVRR